LKIWGTMLPWNNGNYLPGNTTLHPKRH